MSRYAVQTRNIWAPRKEWSDASEHVDRDEARAFAQDGKRYSAGLLWRVIDRETGEVES